MSRTTPDQTIADQSTPDHTIAGQSIVERCAARMAAGTRATLRQAVRLQGPELARRPAWYRESKIRYWFPGLPAKDELPLDDRIARVRAMGRRIHRAFRLPRHVLRCSLLHALGAMRSHMLAELIIIERQMTALARERAA